MSGAIPLPAREVGPPASDRPEQRSRDYLAALFQGDQRAEAEGRASGGREVGWGSTGREQEDLS